MTSPHGQTIFSGIQPSGTLHIGNYLGAIKQWLALEKDNTCYFCIVDEHAITVPYEPKELLSRILNTTATYLAAGLNPEQSVIFVQSHVAAHTELAWLLATQTPYGDLGRMTQFKEKSDKQREHTTLGLFAYPVLQAADILLYSPQHVPVGEDQVQHIELTRDIAKRFNNRFGEVLTIPQVLLNKNAARIMSLTDPAKKMSKSDSEKSYVALTDDPATIRTKIMSAVTETEPIFSFTDSGPAVQNLLRIYQALSEEASADIEQRFVDSGYKEFKEALAELMIEKLTPIQERFQEIRADEDELRITLARGKHHAAAVASQTLTRVKEKMGLL